VITIRTLDGWGWIFAITGAVCVVNALWMLVGPLHWYRELPAAVPDTGPFNPHFVRDIGCAFLAVGAALGWAAFAPRWRTPLVAIAALFLGGHGLLHLYDTLRGALGHDHWWLDAPGVYLPAAVIGYAAFAHRDRAHERGGP
jgi:hypothetical protein